MLRDCSSSVSKNGALQMLFSDTSYNYVCWKICKVGRFLTVLWEYIFYNVEQVEVRKLNEVFCIKLEFKANDLPMI